MATIRERLRLGPCDNLLTGPLGSVTGEPGWHQHTSWTSCPAPGLALVAEGGGGGIPRSAAPRAGGAGPRRNPESKGHWCSGVYVYVVCGR
jgi:hypothetical protein